MGELGNAINRWRDDCDKGEMSKMKERDRNGEMGGMERQRAKMGW